jgi:hypothetical protein
MAPTEATKRHVIEKYVKPARRRGEKIIEVRVGNVLKELGWSNRTPSVFSTLGSQSFQEEAGLRLIEKRGGPASGGPSTTWQFVYDVLEEGEAPDSGRRLGFPGGASTERGGRTATPNGSGLMELAGIFAEAFRKLGGGEEYLKSERNWGPDAWERGAHDGAESPLPGDAK